MIQGNFSHTEIDGDDFEGEDMKIDSSQQELMFDILFKQMYRKPIASIIREITSNCFDSHIEAKIDDPVVISIREDEGGTYISFKDVGIGISPERMKKVYSRPLRSSKRETNDQIGFFGLGSKSPFSYTDTFFLTTIFDGIKYEYLIHRGKTKPRIDKLSEDTSDEHNGSEVKIYFLNSTDKLHFIKELGKELIYFDNVYFTGDISLNNNYKIFEYGTFKVRTDTVYSEELHICIGKVAYPINWGELGRPRVSLPFGLKFDIGELPITPERESVRYVDNLNENGEIISSTKAIINNRIDEFLKELQGIYDQRKEQYFDDLHEYLSKRDDIWTVEVGDKQYYLKPHITPKEMIYTPLKDFKGHIPNNPLFAYRIKSEFRKAHKMKEFGDNNYNNPSRGLSTTDLKSNLFLRFPSSGKLNVKKTQYFYDFAKTNFGSNMQKFYFLGHTERIKAKTILDYLHIVKGDWRKYDLAETNLMKQIKMYKDAIKREVNRLTFDYESFIIPDDWLDAYKLANKKRLDKADDEILVYDYGMDTSENKQYINPTNLEHYNGFIIYGFEADDSTLRFWKDVIRDSKYKANIGEKHCKGYHIHPLKCRIFKIAQKNEKYLSKLKHSIHVEDFMGDNKIFRRFATAAKIAINSKALKLTGYIGGREVPMNFKNCLEYIFTPAYVALANLSKDVADFGGNVLSATPQTGSDIVNKLREEIIAVAEENDLFDKPMLASYEKLERYVDGLDLLNFVVINENSLEFIADFIKLKGKPVNKIWEDKSSFEYELVKESCDKVNYRLSILTAKHEKVSLALNSYSPYSTTTGVSVSYKIKDDLFAKIRENENSIKFLNSVIKYHEKNN